MLYVGGETSVLLQRRILANEDGYLTLDETLLSPEAFQRFDSDGDGKISSLESMDRRGFSVMDTNRDDFVSFEEYAIFLHISPE